MSDNLSKEIRIPGEQVWSDNPDIVWGLDGYPMNSVYPPECNHPNADYHGYKNDGHETMFYHFAVQQYDVRFKYNGQWYYLASFSDHVAVSDPTYSEEYEVYLTANNLIENFKIDGIPLIELIDQLTDLEPI